MEKTAKKILSLCLAMTLVAGMATTALAASAKTYTLKDYEGEHKMTISDVISDTVTGAIEEYAQTPYPTITITTNSKITYDFEMYGVSVQDLEEKPTDSEDADFDTIMKSLVKITNDKVILGGDDGPERYAKGYTVQFIKTGEFNLSYFNEAGGGGCVKMIVTDGTSTTPTTPEKPVENKMTATPTNSKVLVNGAATEFDAYTINGNNYFKLRDVAKVVSGSAKQFEVTWNGEKNAIELVSNKTYTVVGGELAKGDGTAKNAVTCASTILKDGSAVTLTAYTINGNNYFKLRDLGQSFDFDVSWDGANNCITIDTTKSYTAD